MAKLDFSSKRALKIYISERSKEDENGCWVWQNSLDTRGYGQAYDGKKVRKAHRMSYEAYNGDLEEFINFQVSKVVMHSCDNPACVNPHHLSQGSQSSNMKDAATKGRLSRAKGGLNKLSHLDDTQATFIRNLYRSGAFEHKDIACIFGVTKHVIADLLTRSYQT